MTSYANRTVGNIAATQPASLRVFDRLGIDYCCGGKQSLEEACASANVAADKVLDMLADAARNSAEPEKQWTAASARELIGHIVSKHHGFVRAEIPRLEKLLEKVNGKHGSAHPELSQIRELFIALAQELQQHLMKEENILFPYVEQLEGAIESGKETPQACFDSVAFPISRMIADHDDAGELLASIRRLSNNFALPGGACQSYSALYQGLNEFEQDLHRHIHLENNILFPRAVELERSLANSSS